MSSFCEKSGDISPRLLESVKALVQTAQEILGPECDGIQTVKVQTPKGDVRLVRDIDLNNDIYTAGYRNPFEIGLAIIRAGKETLHLPRQPQGVNPRSISSLTSLSLEVIQQLTKQLKQAEKNG